MLTIAGKLRRSRRYIFHFLFALSLFVLLHGCQSPQIDSSTATLPPEKGILAEKVDTGEMYNPPRGEVRLVVISDLNGAYGATDYEPEVDKAIALLPFWQPDMVLCSGDMIAGQKPSLTEEQLKAMWQAFDEHVAAPLRKASTPYGFTIGNHDASSAKDSSGEFLFQQERTIAANYWNNSNLGLDFVDRYNFPFYYSFKYKDVFFVAWDGSSSKIPQDKLDWVEQALESSAARSAKIKILLGHLPLYGIAEGRNLPGEVMDNAEQLRNMLERHGVHTYISGHQHAYYPAHRGKLQLLHTGILGSGPRPFIDSQIPPRKTLTLIDINFSHPESTFYTTYDMKTLQLIKNVELPRFIAGHNGMVLRQDVEPEKLTTAEHAACEKLLSAELCHF